MFYSKQNIPIWERILRLCISIFIGVGAGYFLSMGTLQIVLFVTAAIFASTALVGFCPAYAIFVQKRIGDKND